MAEKKKTARVKEKMGDKELQQNLIKLAYILYGIYLICLLVRYVTCIIYLPPKVFFNNFLLCVLVAVLPVGIWIYSTRFDYFNFYNRKKMGIYFIVINAIATFMQPVYSLLWRYIVVSVIKIEVTRTVTATMVLNLARIGIFVPFVVILAIVAINIQRLVLSESVMEQLVTVKLKHLMDLRENKEYLYDLRCIKNLQTAKDIVIKERDRFTHMLIIGASGTGKTSSTYIPFIANDLNTKLKNRLARTKAIFQMIFERKAGFKKGTTLFNADESRVIPKPEYKKEFEALYEKYKDCGMTVQAPNGSMNKDILKIARARRLTVNNLDPTKTEPAFPNEILIGMNPFDLPMKEGEENILTDDIIIQIKDKAQIFSQVLLALNALSGSTDVYFDSVNKSVTKTVAVVHMLDCYLRGVQANIFMIQKSINKFSNLEEPIKRIEKALNFKVETDTIEKKTGGSKVNPIKQIVVEDLTTEAAKKEKIKEALEEETDDNPLYMTIYTAKQELLGAGQEDLFKQSRGLRNIINNFLDDPRIRRVFSNKNCIDFDRILSNNEITLVNTALEYGDENSTALGLFFMLNFKNAVQRRPEGKRSNHYYYIDEGSQYLHPALDTMWTLFRQYQVGIVFDAQALSQMKKSQKTAYLKDVFLSAGIHIVFGRSSTEEMEVYSKLAGTDEIMVSQKTESYKSILSEDPNTSSSDRTTPTVKNRIEGSAIRNRDFQEVTVLATDEGRVIEAVFGKVSFIDPKEFKQKHIQQIDWKKVYEDCLDKELEEEETAAVEADITAPVKIPANKESREGYKAAPVKTAVKKQAADRNSKSAVKKAEKPLEKKGQGVSVNNNAVAPQEGRRAVKEAPGTQSATREHKPVNKPNTAPENKRPEKQPETKISFRKAPAPEMAERQQSASQVKPDVKTKPVTPDMALMRSLKEEQKRSTISIEEKQIDMAAFSAFNDMFEDM